MRLIVKTVAGAQVTLDVDPDLPLSVARSQAASALDLDKEPLFVLRGKVLQMERDPPLREFGLQDGSFVVAVVDSAGSGSTPAAPNRSDADLARQLQEEEDESTARRVQMEVDGGIARDEQARQVLGEERAAEMAAVPNLVHIRGDIAVCSTWIPLMVDTGAQMSVLSSNLADRLGLLTRLDRTAAGIAGGVGQARILGRLRNIGVRFGELELAIDFAVLDASQLPSQNLAILGLDQLAVHHMVVDLDSRSVLIGGRDGYCVNMLQDFEVPEEFRLHAAQRCIIQ
eukprot:TRINITY_DN97213_c0_g1_i1.p1 TRINITY_DN97213_c0_g1~~TRINITY_DN97213_c0_g1_i1.p1  ORF type:complete len:285 (-),score=66.04 TRINITY_DN97213_c0_g1_i1:2-856(-)